MMHLENTTWLSNAKSFILIALCTWCLSCSTSSKVVIGEPDEEVEFEILDTLYVDASEIDIREEPKTYQGSTPQTWDLLHTDLDIVLDWDKKAIKGTARLDMTPYFYATDKIVLDAKEMDVTDISLSSGAKLNYSYEDYLLTIKLPRAYTRDEKISILIKYAAYPYRNPEIENSLRGFFFIGEGSDFGQVWTQGETEYNSHWFPTIDKPNERCTQEIKCRVPADIKCLSNGDFLGSKMVDGLMQYHYKMDMPHAPYLFALVAGDYAVVEDKWKDIELAYWVDPPYEAYAKKIFNHTPEMLEFFSRVYGYDFPWPSYRQVVCRDFVSGAMENTTAVTFGSFVQKVSGELVDDHNDDIVAHEMAHHWFGDLVTCESWANLTLNEGFANYAEYLWREYKYGLEEAEYHRFNEINGYLNEFYSGRSHPLIHYYHEDKEEMFDAHSYNKGGLVLHMLRKQIGDEAFFTALQKYLNTYKFQAVEVHDLRQAFESVTGLDHNDFFNQWYLREAHPKIEVTEDLTDGMLTVGFQQTQEGEAFLIDFDLLIITDVSSDITAVKMEGKEHAVKIPIEGTLLAIVPDPESDLLAEWSQTISTEAAETMVMSEVPYRRRSMAYSQLRQTEGLSDEILSQGLSDAHWSIRSSTLQYAYNNEIQLLPAQLQLLAESDPNSEVRSSALNLYYASVDPAEAASVINKIIAQDSSYYVLSTALSCLDELDDPSADMYAKKFLDYPGNELKLASASVFADQGKKEDFEFFQGLAKNLSTQSFIDFSNIYAEYLAAAPEDIRSTGSEYLKETATADNSPWRRLGGVIGLFDLSKRDSLAEGERSQYASWLKEIIAGEENPQLVNIYKSFAAE